ncbi:periplasmic murein peptide-binding protein [Methylocaldum marinum]|uniref:Periplasmic murein peptide-binding protein n=1 Tax=Methylocaldum marinum TaxID=1432792 RepID=A0A250KWF3_9GAMM|nr:hypothetical protein [Methylocaldum marinum]BBA35955.1 periplasmic murein peptide-binding protein [Methylocaldum marinum]
MNPIRIPAAGVLALIGDCGCAAQGEKPKGRVRSGGALSVFFTEFETSRRDESLVAPIYMKLKILLLLAWSMPHI